MEITENKLSIYWYGSNTKTGGYSLVNYHLVREMQNKGHQVIKDPKRSNGKAGFFVNHELIEPILDVNIPQGMKAIAYRTWDFGPFPPRWVDKLTNDYDQLWVYANSVKDQAVNSGIPESRIKVIPGGIHTNIFKPKGQSTFNISSDKAIRFLFLGAAVHRKGIDKLLKAYGNAFSPQDDVSLVIKDLSKQDFYRDQQETQLIRKFAEDQDKPELVYLDEFLEFEDLASLIRGSHFGVFPYRAEGFALPILELMACGIPSIVPDFGPAKDYCSPETSLIVDHLQVNLPITKEMVYNSFGHKEVISGINICEVKVDDLTEKLRAAYQMDQTSYQRLSTAGVKESANYTWDKVADKVIAAFGSLKD